MSFYPAVIVSVDERAVTARIEATGHQIKFPASGPFAVPDQAREIGAKGFISFPKVPAVFTLQKAS